jgi:KipI family sensor histidine kinase inhibitor
VTPPQPIYPSVGPLGDSALWVSLGAGVDVELTARVARLASEVRAHDLPGLIGVVPAYAELAVHFEPLVTDSGALTDLLSRLAAAELARPAPDLSGPGTTHIIPVRYDGPDLEAVAHRLELPIAEVIRRHADRTYQVLFLGFVPGFAYLGPLDPSLALPRRPEPRRRIPAGTVAIAGEQTAVYPIETPGGWHLIGRTATICFDPLRDVPNLLAAGDRVRFEPVT